MNSRHYLNNQYDPLQVPPDIKPNYRQLYQKDNNYAAVKFISECCTKLEGKKIYNFCKIFVFPANFD